MVTFFKIKDFSKIIIFDWLIHGLINFNGVSTYPGLFYA